MIPVRHSAGVVELRRKNVMSSNNMKRGNHSGEGETFLTGLKEQGVRVG